MEGRRNAGCPCGSGLRYKACCGRPGDAKPPGAWIDAAMRAALAHQRGGRNVAAHALYRQVLSSAPGLPDAMHMDGVARFALGDHEGALESIAGAVRGFGGRFPGANENLARVVASHLARIASVDTEAIYLRYLELLAARERRSPPPPARVSVVVPSHGHAAYVEAALESALGQTRPADEIVVIDDGSPDGSVARIRAVADRSAGRIRFAARERRGAAATINEAVRASSGDWIAILNSDDRFLPRRLETMLDRVAGARASWGFSRCECIDAAGDAIRAGGSGRADWLRTLQDGVASGDTVGMAFVARNPSISTGTHVFSRALFERVGGYRDLDYTHDWDFCMRASLHDEPVFVPEALYEYRIHGANTIGAGSANADAEADGMLRARYLDALRAAPAGNRFAPLPSVWGALFWLRAIEGGNAALLPEGVAERLARELSARHAA